MHVTECVQSDGLKPFGFAGFVVHVVRCDEKVNIPGGCKTCIVIKIVISRKVK